MDVLLLIVFVLVSVVVIDYTHITTTIIITITTTATTTGYFAPYQIELTGGQMTGRLIFAPQDTDKVIRSGTVPPPNYLPVAENTAPY